MTEKADKRMVTNDLRLDPEVTYMYVDATYFGVVEGVKVAKNRNTITAVWATCTYVKMEGNEMKNIECKREVFGPKKRPEELLMKSNMKPSRENEEMHYSEKFEANCSEAFKQWNPMLIQKANKKEV